MTFYPELCASTAQAIRPCFTEDSVDLPSKMKKIASDRLQRFQPACLTGVSALNGFQVELCAQKSGVFQKADNSTCRQALNCFLTAKEQRRFSVDKSKSENEPTGLLVTNPASLNEKTFGMNMIWSDVLLRMVQTSKKSVVIGFLIAFMVLSGLLSGLLGIPLIYLLAEGDFVNFSNMNVYQQMVQDLLE